jgi:hypothetical protein
VEQLESRLVPYAATGNAWPSPQLVTVSFVPDGTILGCNGSSYLTSNMFSVWNAHFGSPAVWQNQILKALQAWGQQTNINFTVVPDNGASLGSGSSQQGDPGMGDIRIGGYNFGCPTLAQAMMPPPVNNYSIAGDIQFNTGQAFNVGTTYDLFTVAMHEVGHALGLGHSTATGNPTPVMNAAYTGVHGGLSADDIAGIRAVYSLGLPRAQDVYDAVLSNGSFTTATSLTALVDPPCLTALVTGLDVTTTADADYYSVLAPVGTSGTFQLQVQSSGLSLLAPKVTVYAADQVTVLGSATATGTQGAALTVTVNGVTAGQLLYVKVAGNTSVWTGPGAQMSNLFGTGAYALTMNFGTGPLPVVPLATTTLANGNPLSAGGGIPQVPGNVDPPGGDVFAPTGDGPVALPAPAPAVAVLPAATAGTATAAPRMADTRPASREAPVVLPPAPVGLVHILTAAVPVAAEALAPAPTMIPAAPPVRAAAVESSGGAATDQGGLPTPATPAAPADLPSSPTAHTQPASPDLTPAPDVLPADRFWVVAGSDGTIAAEAVGDAAPVSQAPEVAGRVVNPMAAAGLVALLAFVTEAEEPRRHRQRR